MSATSRDIPYTLQEALQVAREILSTHALLVERQLVETEAEQLVMAAYREATQKALTRMEVYSRGAEPFPAAAGHRLLLMASGRAQGGLLQHQIGWQTFLDHEYEVGPDVLVPRPETEFLVITLVDRLQAAPIQYGMEIGLGSGVISIEILKRFQSLKMTASEFSPEAAKRGRANADRILGLEDSKRLQIVTPVEGLEVFEPFGPPPEPGSLRADFIISNPPYLQLNDPIDEDVLRNEPASALFAPEGNPLYFYREIAKQADRYLVPGGFVFLEMPVMRAGEIRRCFDAQSWYTEVLQDLAGLERVLIAKMPGQG